LRLHQNPNPLVPMRLPRRTVTEGLDLFAEGPTAAMLRRFDPHPTWRAGHTTMTAEVPMGDLGAVLAEVEAYGDESLQVDRPLYTVAYTIAVHVAAALGTSTPTPAVLLAERGGSSASFGRRLGTYTYHRSADASTLCAVALRALEDAEVIPQAWPTVAGILRRSGMRPTMKTQGLPGFALLIPPMPTYLLPPPLSRGGTYEHLVAALSATANLDRMEVVANRVGGPAAAARSWLIEFLALCLIGRDADPASASEARRLAAAAYHEVVVAPAAELHRVQTSPHGS
jgi:hypothetical protein